MRLQEINQGHGNAHERRILEMRILITIVFMALLLPVSAFSEDKGKTLYEQWCAQCHGYKGNADAYATQFALPKPRDFTFGTFKFHSTGSGDSPTDEDMMRTIRKGNPGTVMPAWERFTDEEVKAVIEYIKKFAPDVFATKPEPLKTGKAPSASADVIKKGQEVFKSAKCPDCHGEEGRGSGKKAWEEKFKDDWGNWIAPADQTHPWEYRGGSTVEDIFRIVTGGANGTPMTSYQDSLSDEERWAVAHYVKSKQLERKLGISLQVKRVAAMPASTDDKIWDTIDYLDLPVAGQITLEPRHFTPTTTNVRVRGVYAGAEMAIMLEWTDKRPNIGDDGLPPDAARLKFPIKVSGSGEKPHFIIGDTKRPMAVWQWKASDNLAVELVGKGPADVKQNEKQNIKAVATNKEGLYRVIFKRSIDTKQKDDVVFEAGRFVPFSVTLYDGRNKEENNKGTVSAWYYMMLEPTTPMKVFILPPVVSVIVLGIGVMLSNKLRKKGKKKK